MAQPEVIVPIITLENPAFDAAEHKATDIQEKTLDPLMAILGDLRTELVDMPIARRFSREKSPLAERDHRGGIINPMLVGLNEAEYKRAQLDADLRNLQQDAISLSCRIRAVVMDMEATRID